MLRVELPFPPAELSPNKRLHWAKKARVVAKYRGECTWLTELSEARRHIAGRAVRFPGDGEISVSLTFCPPNKRRRDLDNMIASAKSLLDGVATALAVDDSRFALTCRKGKVVKGGKVIVEITP